MEYPDLDITILARSAAKAALITAKHPKIRVVIGDLNDSDIIEEQSALADIVFSTYSHPLEYDIDLTIWPY